MAYELALPTYAATALVPPQAAGRACRDLEAFLKEVETFAMGPYAEALAKGTDLSATEKQSIAEKLHEYTGLPVDYLVKARSARLRRPV